MGHVSGGIGRSSDFQRRTRKQLTSWGWAVSSSNLSFFVTGGGTIEMILILRWYWYWDGIDIEMILILCVGVTVNGWLLYVLVVAGGQSVMASLCQKTAHRLFLFFFCNSFLFLPGCQIHNNANFPFLFLKPACFIFFHWLSPDLFSLFYIWLCQSIKSQSIINIRLMAPSIPSCLFWDPFISGIRTFRHCFVLMEPVSVDQARINLKVVFSFIRRVEKVLTTFFNSYKTNICSFLRIKSKYKNK